MADTISETRPLVDSADLPRCREYLVRHAKHPGLFYVEIAVSETAPTGPGWTAMQVGSLVISFRLEA